VVWWCGGVVVWWCGGGGGAFQKIEILIFITLILSANRDGLLQKPRLLQRSGHEEAGLV